ncbi:tetratricopeptide repeat-containing glycosyltransferase family 2 protein [Bacillus mycoides]|uniref:tetratricopeptide repeat-containing glycosyltransferase family 2 protein n=1 Tax=Bacillus mycoides TaxID=1405 RepID=UPI003D6618D0
MLNKQGITISLCMIVRDEENTIDRCLDAVEKIVDEIIVVDTGSTDRTKEIVAKYTSNIHDFPWVDDFAAARNFAFSKATQEYILWLDADDVLLEEAQESLKTLKRELDGKVDAVSMPYYLVMDSNGKPLYCTRRYRLVKREKQFQWFGKVHEYLAVSGEIYNSNVAITHKKEKEITNRNLKIFQNAVAAGEELSPRDLFYYGNESMDNQKYDDAVLLYETFLNQEEGWHEEKIYACGKLGDCYAKLGDWEKAVETCTKSFRYGIPRGENCTRIGYIYMEQQKYNEAIFWFKLATEVPLAEDSPFHSPASYTWIPYLQMCICYSRLGDQDKAYYYNELAASYVPNNAAIQYNRKYFRGIYDKQYKM